MSRQRHEMKRRAAGGKVTAYAGGDSNVMKEAKERKRGGRAKHHEVEGEKAKMRGDRKRARGGRMMSHDGGHTNHHEHGKRHAEEAHAARHAVKHRARGGAVGADKRPLSSASKIKEVPGEGREDEPKNPKGEPANP